MLTTEDLKNIARARLRDADALLAAGRYDGAIYLCGYAVELALKSRICRTMKWQEYPLAGEYRTFRTHDLVVLLHLTGREQLVRAKLMPEWSVAVKWDTSLRYKPVGTANRNDAELRIKAVRRLVKEI